jgi:hypothetical protein
MQQGISPCSPTNKGKELWYLHCYPLEHMLMRSEDLPDIALEFATVCMDWDDTELKRRVTILNKL